MVVQEQQLPDSLPVNQTIIIPHIADQPGWGLRVYELGVGSKPISKKSLSAENLSKAIMFALQPKIVNAGKSVGTINENRKWY